MHFPVLVALEGASSIWEAYDALEAVMAPFTLHPLASQDDVIDVDPEPAVRHFLSRPWECFGPRQPIEWPLPEDPLAVLRSSADETERHTRLRDLAVRWAGDAIGAYAANNPECGVAAADGSQFGLRLGGSGRCDGWVVGGVSSGLLRLREPGQVAVVEDVFGPTPTALQRPSEARAVVGTKPERSIIGGRQDVFAARRQAAEEFPVMSLAAVADIGQVGDLERSCVRDVFDEQVTVVVRGRWMDFEQLSAVEYFDLRDQIDALPDSAWLAVLDAHT